MSLFKLDGTELKNSKGYPIKLFVVYVRDATVPDVDDFRKLLTMICDNLNARNKEFKTSVGADMFLCPEKDLAGETVWSDILGQEQSLRELRKQAGSAFPGWFDANVAAVHSFFGPRNLSLESAKELYAPIDEMSEEARVQAASASAD